MTETIQAASIGNNGEVIYAEVNANIRHYSGLRYAVLSAYLVLMGLLGVMGPSSEALASGHSVWEFFVGAFAIVMLCSTAIMQESRTSTLLVTFKDYARSLECFQPEGMWRRIQPVRHTTHRSIVGLYVGLGVLSLGRWILIYW